VISEEIVDATWRDSASLSPAEARRRFDRLAKLQPALLAYVLGETEEVSPEAAELANYLFFVIARMFYAAEPKLRKVTFEAVESIASEVETAVASLAGAHDKFLERAAAALCERQPNVFRYLTEAVMEAPEDEDDPLPLTPDDQGAIFLILATAIKALDERGLPQAPRRGGLAGASGRS
jgi:hypothetical protein